MAITVVLDRPHAKTILDGRLGGVCIISGTLTVNTYATSGVDATPITKLFKTCDRVLVESNTGYLFQWDKTNKKLIVYRATDNVAGTRIEVADGVDLSGLTGVSFIAVGRI